MIRWALAEMRRPSTETRRRRRSSSSAVSTLGSITTPLPITHSVLRCSTPEGIRCSLNSRPSRTMVWPALLPPWKRITASARSASRSTTLPLPSSPHWAPTITVEAIAPQSTGANVSRRSCPKSGNSSHISVSRETVRSPICSISGSRSRFVVTNIERRSS